MLTNLSRDLFLNKSATKQAHLQTYHTSQSVVLRGTVASPAHHQTAEKIHRLQYCTSNTATNQTNMATHSGQLVELHSQQLQSRNFRTTVKIQL